MSKSTHPKQLGEGAFRIKAQWALDPGESTTPFEIGGAYPMISVFCTKGAVEVQFITDGYKGIPDGGSGYIIVPLKKGNSHSVEARRITITSPKLYSAGGFEVEYG